MILCGQCKYWRNPEAAEDWRLLPRYSSKTHGMCAKINHDIGSSSEIAVLRDAEGMNANLETTKDFGCILGEK